MTAKMPRGFMLYVSAAAVGLLGFGQPVPAEATDTSQTHPSVVTTAVPDTATTGAATAASVASDAATAVASSINSSSSASISSSTISISVTMTQSSSTSSSQTTTTPTAPITISFDTDTCQSKTINYITHTLPQQCLRTSWSSANATSVTAEASSEAAPAETAAAAAANTENTQEGEAKEDDENPEDLATGSFMSFEEWKVLQLKKAGQDPAELQARRRQQQQQHHAGQNAGGAGGDINIDSIGDDGEIALDFDVLNEKVSEMAGSASAQVPGQYGDGNRQDKSVADGSSTASGGGPGGQEEAVVYADGATQYYRSKDAGKTGKERFSFASFDAGATVLKANKGVKNAKAILVENKDSYMLLECRTRDKHVIVELSDDILVDTVVLANFEFFSSMVRRFRVSVSDRYPVKADRWRALGEYEARNSRDIQPFLIEHPQIWAKYIRIDFLTHYGSEYYCPISLLRVHGTRMLDSWLDSENGRDAEDDEDFEHEEQYEQHQQQQYGQQQAEQQYQQQEEQAEPQTISASDEKPVDDEDATKVVADAVPCDPAGYTPWNPIAVYLRLFIADNVCLPTAAPEGYKNGSIANADGSLESKPSQSHGSAAAETKAEDSKASSKAFPSSGSSSSHPPENTSTPSNSQSAGKDTPAKSASNSSSSSTSSNASSSSDASKPSQASDSPANPSATAAKAAEQEAAAAAAAQAKKKSGSAAKVAAAPGTQGNQQAPPTTTVQTSHSKNRASSGGAGGGSGSSAQSGGSPSGSTGGSGSNPGATGSSSSGTNNNNNNGATAGGAPSPPPPPIVQESFFKSVTKRLQLLESNTSLSLQYIEDQSRFLQEALRKMERKQISRVDSFLDTLNNTVLSELRNMRQQYDQIWQSTVIALETQREQNQRETVALSDRLNVLADEVVFQKRMAILQSVLLLCCLALVIFSRGLLSGGSASVPLDVNAATAAAMAAAAGYIPPGAAMSPSPSSPPSASSSVGLRSNLRSLRNNFRNPYAAYSVYASGYPLSTYSAGSPPPPSGLRAQGSVPANTNGGVHAVPAPINKNKVLPLTPTTPTSPASPGSPLSPDPMPSNESQDSLLDVDEQEPQVVVHRNEKGQGPVLAAPKPLTPPASLRLSDIEEAADQLEEDAEESSEDRDDDNETILSEATTVLPDTSGSVVSGGGGGDSSSLFMPTAVTPTKAEGTEQNLPSSASSMTTSFLSGPVAAAEGPGALSRKHKHLPSLPEHNSD